MPAHKLALRDLTYQDYLEINQRLHGRWEECAICGRPPSTRRLDRDHDHASGTARGLLCARCNQRLERGGDTIEWLTQALAYITRASESQAQSDQEQPRRNSRMPEEGGSEEGEGEADRGQDEAKPVQVHRL